MFCLTPLFRSVYIFYIMHLNNHVNRCVRKDYHTSKTAVVFCSGARISILGKPKKKLGVATILQWSSSSDDITYDTMIFTI